MSEHQDGVCGEEKKRCVWRIRAPKKKNSRNIRIQLCHVLFLTRCFPVALHVSLRCSYHAKKIFMVSMAGLLIVHTASID